MDKLLAEIFNTDFKLSDHIGVMVEFIDALIPGQQQVVLFTHQNGRAN